MFFEVFLAVLETHQSNMFLEGCSLNPGTLESGGNRKHKVKGWFRDGLGMFALLCLDGLGSAQRPRGTLGWDMWAKVRL